MSPEGPVLAIDTAGPVVGVALCVGGEVRCRTERVRRGAEARLVPWAVALCEEFGIGLDDLVGVGVARGPGAFTGVRVGMATAVGLALALDVPIWPGSSLSARASRLAGAGPVLAMLDARKSRVYAALYQDGALLHPAADVDPAVALGWPQGGFRATGEGALVYRESVERAGGTVADHANHPGVDALARLAVAGLSAGEGVSADQLQPVYLRAPDAKKPTS